jgi:hypothetical protein
MRLWPGLFMYGAGRYGGWKTAHQIYSKVLFWCAWYSDRRNDVMREIITLCIYLRFKNGLPVGNECSNSVFSVSTRQSSVARTIKKKHLNEISRNACILRSVILFSLFCSGYRCVDLSLLSWHPRQSVCLLQTRCLLQISESMTFARSARNVSVILSTVT